MHGLLVMKSSDFYARFPNYTCIDFYTCKLCGQPLWCTFGNGFTHEFSHQRWHECQTDHKPDPIEGWAGENNEYMDSWKDDLICWLLKH